MLYSWLFGWPRQHLQLSHRHNMLAGQEQAPQCLAASFKQTLLQGAGEKMVVLRGKSSQQLRALQQQAEQCELPVHMVG